MRIQCVRNWSGFCIAGLFAVASAGCSPHPAETDSWGVMVASLPEKILPENLADGTVSYIFSQTHEPLFLHEDGQNFTSKILSEWSRNIDYTEFRFCPNTSLKFEDNTAFTSEFLQAFLGEVTRKYVESYKISREGGCSFVRFPVSQPGYPYFLARLNNSPSVTRGGVSYGLGAFKTKTVSKHAIELERKVRVRNGYNKITLYPYTGPEDRNLTNPMISDFNKLSSFQQPGWIKDEYQSFENVELRVIGLAINHPDVRVRRVLYNCIDVRDFRHAAIPARKDFYDIRSVLPVGVPGAKGGLAPQSCEVPKWLRGKKAVFANPRTDNLRQLSDFADRFDKKFGLKLVIKQYTPAKLDAELMDNSRRRDYNLVLVATANSTPDQEGFFFFYAGKKRAIDSVPKEITRDFERLAGEVDPLKKKKLAESISARLGEGAFVLPLYQTFARLYYPRGIRNLVVGRGYTETPKVGDLRF